MIRRAKISEITDILTITKACAAYMVKNEIYQWNDQYPTKEVFENDIERQELYVLDIEDLLIGTLVITTSIDEEYIPVRWLTPAKNNLYIHRLAVHPDHQKKGHAQQLMDFAENHARKNSFESIRLDTFSQNTRNQKFYETRGYQKLGSVSFSHQSEYPFYCYELVL